MIVATSPAPSYLATTWVAGLALTMLVIGGYGATQPLLPRADEAPGGSDQGNEVMLEQFSPPAIAAERTPPEPEWLEVPEVELPPLPTLQAPLRPPEMIELTELEEAPSPPKPSPQPQRSVKPAASPSPGSASGSSQRGAPAAPTLFTGGGGRFPAPIYPASAQTNREQGMVRLLVTVEASGMPSSVVIQQSSGSRTLDAAARDQIGRRWRWPAGEVRRYIVPIRFVLQP